MSKSTNSKMILISGVIFIVSGLWISTRYFVLHRSWHKTTATAMNYRQCGGKSIGGEKRYRVNYSANNKQISTFVEGCGASVGSEIKIRYDPKNIERAETVSSNKNTQLLLYSAFFTAVGVKIVRVSRQRSFPKKRLNT
jgi:hypothetical protein